MFGFTGNVATGSLNSNNGTDHKELTNNKTLMSSISTEIQKHLYTYDPLQMCLE